MTSLREQYDDRYGSRVVAESFQPTLPYYFRTYTPHGLVYQASWLWCGLVDEEGNRYTCLREWKTEYSMNVLISKLDPNPDVYASRLYKRLYMGIVLFEKNQEKQALRIDPAFAPSAFSVRVEPQHMHWTDAEGDLDLDFNALGPALRYLCPGEKEDGFYMSEFCRVEGTLQGKPVKGFGGIDNAFGTPGVGWLHSKIYRLLEKYWVVWANRYEDESLEYGICFDGEADFNMGFVVRDGVVTISDCSFNMENYEDGFPKRAAVSIGKENYIFQTTARVSRLKGFMQWANGEMKREGDEKKIVEHFSWMEFFG